MAEPRNRVVGVKREVLDRQYGHWCNACSLPSGVLVWVAVSSTSDPRVMVGVFPICDECEGTNITADGDRGWDALDDDADTDPALVPDDEDED